MKNLEKEYENILRDVTTFKDANERLQDDLTKRETQLLLVRKEKKRKIPISLYQYLLVERENEEYGREFGCHGENG